MLQWLLSIWLILGLAACSHWPGFTPPVPPVALTLSTPLVSFRLDGRVSVKAGEESFSGGLVWRREGTFDELLLRTPLGQGVAELRGTPAGMTLESADGRLSHASDADALVRQALGLELPLRGLAWWVVGQPRPDSIYQAVPDDDGHLGELQQDGWHIYFSRYDLRLGQWLPAKLIARRGEDLEVRLVVDNWETP